MMLSLPQVITPVKSSLPIDQMQMGLDLLRTVHAALQDHTFVDGGILTALSGTMFTALEILEPVRDILNAAEREEPTQGVPSKLVEVINEYRTGDLAFRGWEKRGYPDELTAIEQTYGPPMRALQNWNSPLESLEDVREAVRLAFLEDAVLSDIATEPLRAALIYLEKITGWNESKGGPHDHRFE
ncbi:hypothetical protein [Brucella anthropi]|uniref:hypothetical protein n=1 Tax=Brucella anthropi TaxID=529 RepID=UPI002360209E|nr:hypothetical protein [Brucella anthropi]